MKVKHNFYQVLIIRLRCNYLESILHRYSTIYNNKMHSFTKLNNEEHADSRLVTSVQGMLFW